MSAKPDVREKASFTLMVEVARTSNEAETISFAEKFAGRLVPSDVVALNGDLGSGKTQFVKGVCLGLGVVDVVTSPSFVIMNQYKAARNGAVALPIFHFDFYRIRSIHELYDLGVEEYFYGKGICLIEWARAATSLLPMKRYEVALSVLSEENTREITIEKVEKDR
ncbi:MAG: tRNA (adenosine(37)-N6)-threonylcarbamoyltransferase complex ATPase subunit type 1 TsaE [Bacteroidota bacterium]